MVKKDLTKNIVYVSRNLNDAHIWTDRLVLKDVIVRTLDGSCRSVNNLLVRLRHLGELIPAKLENNTLYFEQKIKRPASGQSAVFYDGEICLGGGVIAD